MSIRPYIDDDLQARRLVMPFSLTVPKGQQWYLIYRDTRRDQPDFVTFRKWIIAAAGNKSPGSPESLDHRREAT
jgi:LysR family glycine cleavage system transcriptional activator